MARIRSYLSLIKFSHTIFAMPFALIGFCLAAREPLMNWIKHTNTGSGAEARPLWMIFSLVILCMVFARSAAMAFNRYLDRSIDAKNPRTAVREIPAGVITPGNALIFTIISCALFITCCALINTLCFYLSPVALAIVLGYSYTKRFTALCHLVLGLGLSLAPIGAWLAVTAKFEWLPLFFSVTVLFWVSGFDIIYSLQDEEFDRSQKLYSMPAWLGKKSALRVSGILHVITALSVLTAGWYGNFGTLYWVGAGLFIGFLIYQHLLVKPDDLSKVNIAFMTTNGMASVVFAVLAIADLFIFPSF
jgi:4-hydroxybenzoate polyprenyltransferase